MSQGFQTEMCYVILPTTPPESGVFVPVNDVRAMKIREIIDEGGHVYLIVLAPAPQQKSENQPKPANPSPKFPQTMLKHIL